MRHPIQMDVNSGDQEEQQLSVVEWALYFGLAVVPTTGSNRYPLLRTPSRTTPADFETTVAKYQGALDGTGGVRCHDPQCRTAHRDNKVSDTLLSRCVVGDQASASSDFAIARVWISSVPA